MNPTAQKSYWTEGTVVNGLNTGGGKLMQGTAPEPISKVITMDDLNTTTNLIPVAPKATTTPYTPTVTAPSGMAIGTDGTATYTPPPPPPEPSAKEKTLRQRTMELIGMDEKLLEQQPEVTKQLQEQQQVVEKENNKVSTYNTWMLKKREIENKVREMEATNPEGQFAGARNAVIQDYQRKASAELADLAIQAQVAQGLVDSARQTIKDTIEAQFAPIEDRIARRTQYAQLASNDLTESEKYQLDELNKKDEINQKEVSTYATNLANTVFENGAPVGVRTKIFNIAGDYASGKITKEQAQAKMSEAAGSYGGNVKDTIAVENARLQNQKLTQEIEANKPITGEYADVINGAAGLVPATKKQQVKQNIATSLANGDYKTAYAEISNAVSDGLTGTNKTKFDDANTDLGILANVRNAVQEYSDAGGNMGLLKGTEEEIKRKLGIDSGKASALAVQLWREFQTYRSNMTGAAFTPQESRDYASVNPTLGKSLDLNLSVIDGAMAQLGNRVNSTITRRIPDAQDIFDKAYGSASNQQTINISGKDYTVGQVYQDASGAKWVVDSNGKWTTQ